MKKILVFDVGGSSVKVGILNLNGEILERDNFITPGSNIKLLNKMESYITDEIHGMALSMPGAVNQAEDRIDGTSAIEYIHSFNYMKYFKGVYDINVSMANDANCAGLAEVWLGSAKDYSDVISYVVGSGVGGCVIVDKKLHVGHELYGGEFGYQLTLVDGKMQKLSALSSSVNMVKSVNELLHTNLDGAEVMDLYDENEEVKTIIDKAIFHLALSIYNTNVSFNPEVFLIGGGISNNKKYIVLLNHKIEEIQKMDNCDGVLPKVVTCHYKNDANLIGAVYNYINTYEA